MGRVAIADRQRQRRLRRRAVDHPTLRAHHREYRVSLWRYFFTGSAATALTAPVIYSLLLPFAVLDLWVIAYQAVCFRAWGLARVSRRRYFAIDRHRLSYLNGLEKVNCLYCSYANGVLAFAREVAGRTELYWCPIRHARRIAATHRYYDSFVPYGDAAAYRAALPSLRARVRK